MVIIIENNSSVLIARVRRAGNGGYLTQSTTTSISVKSYKQGDGSLVHTSTPVIADVVFNTLQTGSEWQVDETGYNLRIPLSGSHFPDGQVSYQLELEIVPTDGFTLRHSVIVNTSNLYGI